MFPPCLEETSIVRMRWEQVPCLSFPFSSESVCFHCNAVEKTDTIFWSVALKASIYNLLFTEQLLEEPHLCLLLCLSDVRRLWITRYSGSVIALALAVHDSLCGVSHCRISLLYRFLSLGPVFSLDLWGRHCPAAVIRRSLKGLVQCGPSQTCAICSTMH